MPAPDTYELAAACEGVTKTYRAPTGAVEALRGIDARFPAGRVTAVVGPSGSGKSSLLRLLACVDRPTEGSVMVAGFETSRLGARARRRLRRRHLGYVFQQPADNLLEYLTVEEHLVLAAHLRGTGTEDIAPVLEATGLGPRRDHRPEELSGGEQQRLAVAAAVVGRPALVVADEPTAELDHVSADRVLSVIHDLASTGVAFAVSTHDEMVMRRADSSIRLDQGALARPVLGAWG